MVSLVAGSITMIFTFDSVTFVAGVSLFALGWIFFFFSTAQSRYGARTVVTD